MAVVVKKSRARQLAEQSEQIRIKAQKIKDKWTRKDEQ